MDTTQSRRHQRSTTPTPPSPRLLRSTSGAPPETRHYSSSLNSSQSLMMMTNRSKSTTKSRTINKENEENYLLKLSTLKNLNMSSTQKKAKESYKDGFVRFLQRGSSNNVSNRKTKSVMGSPSAWALSPGRSYSPSFAAPPESPVTEKKRVKSAGGGGGGVSGVLRYFRQKKGSPMQEEEYHRFRVLYNRLLQWRFVNARGDATMADLKINSEERLFYVLLRILKMRNSVTEKRIQVQKLKQEIKFYQIVIPQMSILNEWTKLDGKNFEAVSRLTRKLVGISFRLPLVKGVKADLTSLQEAMSVAVEIMDGIEESITKFLSQVEKIVYLLTELVSILEQENEYLEEVEKIVTLVPALTESEKSLRVHLIQTAKESGKNKDN